VVDGGSADPGVRPRERGRDGLRLHRCYRPGDRPGAQRRDRRGREALRRGYLTGPLHKLLSGGDTRSWFLENSHLGERGLRTVGAWPSDDPYEALVEILQRQIEETSDPEKKTRLQAFRSSLADVGRATVAGLLVELLKGDVHF
jgi:hypothetical protein